MVNAEELAKKVIYYRSIRRMSINDLAAKLKISVNTLQKIIRKEHVKDSTRIFVWEKLDMFEKE